MKIFTFYFFIKKIYLNVFSLGLIFVINPFEVFAMFTV